MAELSEHTIKTYRYLRLAMVTLIAMLAASVAIEWWQAGRDCFQTSISAYYYTPVQAIFVGMLISIGVCMVALKGNTEWEDILLNGGGMLAPVVALVPTPGKGKCRSVPVTFRDTPADIANNMGALFVAGGLGLAITLCIAIAAWRARGELSGRRSWDHRQTLGLVVAALVLGGGIAWFSWNRDGFTRGAHYTAAIALFVCIIGVVILNAKGFDRQRQGARRMRLPYANRYSVHRSGDGGLGRRHGVVEVARRLGSRSAVDRRCVDRVLRGVLDDPDPGAVARGPARGQRDADARGNMWDRRRAEGV